MYRPNLGSSIRGEMRRRYSLYQIGMFVHPESTHEYVRQAF
jgi:hypothetical protein